MNEVPLYEGRVLSAGDLFSGYQLPAADPKAAKFEYEHFIKLAAKMTGSKYFVMHSRLSKAFDGRDADFILSYVRRWCHEAEKSSNPGLVFNARFKQYRNANAH